jgi:hypothetical protein
MLTDKTEQLKISGTRNTYLFFHNVSQYLFCNVTTSLNKDDDVKNDRKTLCMSTNDVRETHNRRFENYNHPGDWNRTSHIAFVKFCLTCASTYTCIYVCMYVGLCMYSNICICIRWYACQDSCICRQAYMYDI